MQELLAWGRRRLDWTLAQRLQGRRTKAEKVVEGPDILDLIENFTETSSDTLAISPRKPPKLAILIPPTCMTLWWK